MRMKAKAITGWKAIAQHVGFSVRTLQRWQAQGRFPARRVPGGQTVFALERDIEEWVQSLRLRPPRRRYGTGPELFRNLELRTYQLRERSMALRDQARILRQETRTMLERCRCTLQTVRTMDQAGSRKVRVRRAVSAR